MEHLLLYGVDAPGVSLLKR